MDSFDFDNVKAEKLKALRRFNRFKRIGSFFRTAEIILALLFVFWTLTQLPFVVKLSGDFLRRIASVISTPLFVFLLGNAIVLVLFTTDQTKDDSSTVTENEIYDAFVRSVENQSKPSDQTEEIVYVDKQIIITDSNIHTCESIIPHVEVDVSESDHIKVYKRSKSDVVLTKQSPVMVVKRSLQRSETEKKCRDVINNYAEDNLSNEEFQKTIEAFIAKQLMFRRQESLAVVVHNKA